MGPGEGRGVGKRTRNKEKHKKRKRIYNLVSSVHLGIAGTPTFIYLESRKRETKQAARWTGQRGGSLAGILLLCAIFVDLCSKSIFPLSFPSLGAAVRSGTMQELTIIPIPSCNIPPNSGTVGLNAPLPVLWLQFAAPGASRRSLRIAFRF